MSSLLTIGYSSGMSAPAFLIHSLDSAAKQVHAVFTGINGDLWNHQVVPEAMSPIQTATHLAHCYTAFLAEAAGEHWDWSKPFELGTSEPGEALNKMNSLRNEAIDVLKSTSDEAVITKAVDFLLMHDCYHVGQMAIFRMNTDPSWDPYSLY